MTDREVMQQALEQQQQAEPVAYYHPLNGFYWAKPTSIFAPTVVDVPPIPLYTTPPKRPWQGLTDDDVHEITKDVIAFKSDVMKFIREAETKLREKNT